MYTNMLFKLFLISFCYSVAHATLYDCYTGTEANETEIARLKAASIIEACTVDIEPCDESDWRRVDGSCNNLKYITAGAFNTPQLRLLEPDYNIVNGSYEPRTTKSGNPWALSREIRNQLLPFGAGIDGHFSQLASYYPEFMFVDIGSIHDIDNYVENTPYCCEERGKTDYMCIPDKITDDDPVHRFNNLRCLNLTRPLSFQNVGCTASNSAPDRVNNATVFFDLSNVYTYSTNVITKIRTYESGLLKTETVNGRIFPSDANENTTCFIQDAIETGCTRDVPNGLLGSDLFTTWFWRLHNYVATQLAELNPCWDDDQLFYTSRDIVIGIHQQIYYYEYLPKFLGKELLVSEGIISEDSSSRDSYDPSIVPQLALEYAYAYRWFHIIQDMRQKMYDENFNFVKEYPVGNFSLRVQDLAIDDTMPMITRGVYVQPNGNFDKTVHPDMANVGLGHLQKTFDVTTADLTKGKYFGFQPYIKYRNFCSNKTYTGFEDFLDVMTEENVELLKTMYEDPEDVDLLAGMWCEKPMEGAYVPPTVGCLIMDQLKRSMVTDRHWFERPNRPHAFTEAQLLSVRNTTLATILCEVGDDVTTIQSEAFLRISYENPLVSCDEIPRIDLSSWMDSSCDS